MSGPEIVYKPIGLLNASPRSRHAYDSLTETLRTMSTHVIPDASPAMPLDGRRLDAHAIAADAHLADLLRVALEGLVRAAREYRKQRASLLA